MLELYNPERSLRSMNVMRLLAPLVVLLLIPALAPAALASGTRTNTLASTTKSVQKPGKRRTYRRTGRGAFFVPPPPPYMPSILPELAGTRIAEVEGLDAEEAPPENPYKKYFFSADGGDGPKPVEHRSGVSTWVVKPVSYTRRR